MKIILIRHGEKDEAGAGNDLSRPLSSKGRKNVCGLGDTLRRIEPKISVFLTSDSEHAWETGNTLALLWELPPERTAFRIKALTPKSPKETFEEIIDEAECKNDSFNLPHSVIAIVGHEPRLSQLSARLTSRRPRPLNRAEAMCVKADSLREFLAGKGELDYRVPVADYQGEQLRPKVESKMQVATFLAGFTFAVLADLLKDGGKLDAPKTVAVISLTFALALFIASVYVYDRLAMPEGFWEYEDRLGGWLFKINSALHPEEDLRRKGPLYTYMVWTWKWVFNPAVLLSLVGFGAILYDVREGLVLRLGGYVILGAWVCLIVVFVVVAYYAVLRPRLGID